MKKAICTLLAILLLLLSATACSVPNENGDVSKPDSTTTSTQQTEATDLTQATQGKEEGKLEKFKFCQISVYCMVPEKCARKTNGSIASTTNNKAYLATIFTGEKGGVSNLEDILTASAAAYSSDVNKYLSTNIEADALKAQTTEKVTVSGYEAVKFSGQIKNIEDGNYQIYGYSMIIDERPVMFLGILVSKEQGNAELNAMKALIDQMAGSIFK